MIQAKLPSKWIVSGQMQEDSDSAFSESEELRKSEVGSQWTRVKSISAMKRMSVQLFDLDKDIQADLSTTRARKHIAVEKSICLF